MTTVSVLLPVYNGARYLSAAVDSILAQTFADFELLILDDGSTDETPAILARYAHQDGRVSVISRANKGLVTSLNELLSHARGRYVARMDADDIALPERFALQVHFLDAHADVVCVGGGVEFIDDRGRLLLTSVYPHSDNEIQDRLLEGFTAICHPAAMMRRESLVAVGGYDEAFALAEDLDLWLRLGEIGKLANVDNVVLSYRFHSASASERASAEQLTIARAACERAWRRRGVPGKFKAKLWRPSADRASQHESLLLYGWWAWRSRQHRTALSYALRGIALRPARRDGWVLLACCLFRPLRAAIDRLHAPRQ